MAIAMTRLPLRPLAPLVAALVFAGFQDYVQRLRATEVLAS